MQSEEQKAKKNKENEQSFRGPCDTIEYTNVNILRTPEREKRKKKAERMLEELIIENFLN